MEHRKTTHFLTFTLSLILMQSAFGAGSKNSLNAIRDLGTAEFQNEEYSKAAKHFRKTLKLSDGSLLDQVNLGLSETLAQQHEKAISTLTGLLKKHPNTPHAHYLLGIIFLRQDRYSESIREFTKLLKMDPLCAPAHYNLGVALKRNDQIEKAQRHWKKTVALNPKHASAYFALFNYFNSKKDIGNAKRAYEHFRRIKDAKRVADNSRMNIEKSKYFQLMPYPWPQPQKNDREIVVSFLPEKDNFGLQNLKGSRAIAMEDFDDDGLEDLVVNNTLWRSVGNRWTQHGEIFKSTSQALNCLEPFDFNGDGHLDLAICDANTVRLLKGKGTLSFEELPNQPPSCGPAEVSFQLHAVDIDHEGDLDLVLLCRNSNKGDRFLLLRNNGDSSFSDVTKASKIELSKNFLQNVTLSDFDAKNDIDLLFSQKNGNVQFFLNRRDGTFRESTATHTGIKKLPEIQDTLRGDLNGDSLPDLIWVGSKGEVLPWLNQGDTKFFQDHSSSSMTQEGRSILAHSGTLMDVDNDGDLDLFLIGSNPQKSLALFRNENGETWRNLSQGLPKNLPAFGPDANVFSVDIDQDGDLDLLLNSPGQPFVALQNKGGNQNHSLRLRLRGRKNNSDGFGVKVWIKDPSFSLFRESFKRWIHLGVGPRKVVEILGLRWPTGIEQNEFSVGVRQTKTSMELAERPGLAESCPFLYAFNGKTFEFIGDFLDTTPVGVSLAPGELFFPNHREALLIEGSQLKPTTDGWLRLQVTQELAELTHLDRVDLFAIDHPVGSKIIPNDRFSGPPFAPFRIHHVSHPIYAKEARDHRGKPVGQSLLQTDRKYALPMPYPDKRYPGLTQKWELILETPPIQEQEELWLFLRGSTLWTDASVNHAVAQNPNVHILPISLDIQRSNQTWKRVREDVGVPAGINKFLPVRLTDLVRPSGQTIRLSSTMAILWDEAFFAKGSTKNEHHRIHSMLPLQASLHPRGFSELYSPDEQLPDLYDYDRLQKKQPFRVVQAGHYTKFGDVKDLLLKHDDEYVTLAPGDELTLDFPAHDLPPLKTGWQRDYIFEAKGFIKDAEWRTAHAEEVEPLPYRDMTSYPPPPGEGYDREKHREYLQNFQTRLWPPEAWFETVKNN